MHSLRVMISYIHYQMSAANLNLFMTLYIHMFLYNILVESYNGTYLRLFRLERRQMGAYLCIASNDVPPAVSKRVSLSVHCKYMYI